MWPGEYPPEGRRSARWRGWPRRSSASMWPGEYPPEGRGRQVGGEPAAYRFNVAGGVSPGRSRRPGGRQSLPPGFNVAGGVSPGRSSFRRRPARRRRRFNVAGGVSPGRSPSGIPLRIVSDGHASMWPGEYPPEGRAHRAVAIAAPELQCGRGSIPRKVVLPPRSIHHMTKTGFNVAGGVSPGRSESSGWKVLLSPSLQCGRGSIPRKVTAFCSSASSVPALQCGRGSIPRKVAGALPGITYRAPLQCGRGSIPRKVTTTSATPGPGSRRFNVAGGVSPGRSRGAAPPCRPTGLRFNVAGGVSPGRS